VDITLPFRVQDSVLRTMRGFTLESGEAEEDYVPFTSGHWPGRAALSIERRS